MTLFELNSKSARQGDLFVDFEPLIKLYFDPAKTSNADLSDSHNVKIFNSLDELNNHLEENVNQYFVEIGGKYESNGWQIR